MASRSSAKKMIHPYIDSGPKPGQGSPVVKGTRMKVIDIALRYELLGMTPDQIVEHFPHLSLPQIHDALSFYYENKADLDAKYKNSQVFIEELKRHYVSKVAVKLG